MEPEHRDNPFEENLCLCSQNMPIHISCLIQWMKKKTNISQQEHVFIYDYCQLFCDICKTPFPQEIEFRNKKIPLLAVESELKKLKNFVLFELFYLDTDRVIGLIALNMADF